MPHETHRSKQAPATARSRRSVLDTLEKPRVAVPMILVSALVGLALAVTVVRVLDAGAGARGQTSRDTTTHVAIMAPAPIATGRPAPGISTGPPPQMPLSAPQVQPNRFAPASAAPLPEPPSRGADTDMTAPATGSPSASASRPWERVPPLEAPAVASTRPPMAVAAERGPSSPARTIAQSTADGAAAEQGAGAAVAPSASLRVPESKAQVRRDDNARAGPDATTEPRVAIPPVSTEAQRNVADVLAVAAQAERPDQNYDVLDAAENVRRGRSRIVVTSRVDPALARKLNNAASRAYWDRRNVAEALALEQRAFDANPNDVEVAGNLAFYYLKQVRPQPELARWAALHALTTPADRYHMGRIEDWTSLGIASALLGRSNEGRNAFLATAALSADVDRVCRAALSAVASYGQAVRGPATALLYRIYAQGRSRESPNCAWPPNWAEGRRYP